MVNNGLGEMYETYKDMRETLNHLIDNYIVQVTEQEDEDSLKTMAAYGILYKATHEVMSMIDMVETIWEEAYGDVNEE